MIWPCISNKQWSLPRMEELAQQVVLQSSDAKPDQGSRIYSCYYLHEVYLRLPSTLLRYLWISQYLYIHSHNIPVGKEFANKKPNIGASPCRVEQRLEGGETSESLQQLDTSREINQIMWWKWLGYLQGNYLSSSGLGRARVQARWWQWVFITLK